MLKLQGLGAPEGAGEGVRRSRTSVLKAREANPVPPFGGSNGHMLQAEAMKALFERGLENSPGGACRSGGLQLPSSGEAEESLRRCFSLTWVYIPLYVNGYLRGFWNAQYGIWPLNPVPV